ncbi:MAG TPA: MT-A70 family methyltransferase [Xanthobacteraceae bacterium]|nr:MT-A70 family methyltransferase [Xanthobacteraceae bacterium]
MKSTQLRLPFRGEISRTGWELPADLTFEEWQTDGELLGKIEHAVSWWIGDWWIYAEHRYGERKAIVEREDWEGPSFDNCAHCGMVARKFETWRRRQVLSFNHHREVAGLDTVDADALLDRCEQIKADTGQAPTIRELRNWVTEIRRQENLRRIAAGAMAWPTGRYAVVYADPPWRYDFSPTISREIENQYPTMDLTELCALPVGNSVTDDAILYLWATAPKLDAAATDIVKAWGFEYRTNFVWVKDKIGMGYHARGQHEHLLVATRGVMPPPAQQDRVSSVVYGERVEHSAKPVEFYELIERFYPDLPKLELFARAPRLGWAAYGNELPR